MTNETRTTGIKREGISAVWLVPIIALLFGAWLVFKAFTEQGEFITVRFDTASGIVVGKTEVRYKGLTVGKVTEINISKDIQSVEVEIEMVSSTKKRLTDKTIFWAVTADVSYQGVTGLDTLLSGSYIGIQPDLLAEGKPQNYFVALEKAPPLSHDTPGLHVLLKAESLGSLGINSAVSFKKMKVGYVSNYLYDDKLDLFTIDLFIEPEYSNLVKTDSLFWNSSGFDIQGSFASGVSVKTDSIASIIAGGIAFDTPSHTTSLSPAENGDEFELFDDYESAEMGYEIELELGWNSGIDIGTPILYQGITLGRVQEFSKMDTDNRKVKTLVSINPRVIPYLNDETVFYVVSPKFDLSGVENLNNVVFGTHISLIPSTKGEHKKSYQVYGHRPAYSYNEPGLHLVLNATEIGSLQQGSGVFYKQQKVGTIQAIEGIGPDDYLVHIHITPEYENYVDIDSNFWNASGLHIKGGLQNLDIKLQSVQSLLAGGIAFDKGLSSKYEKPSNGTKYNLYHSNDLAQERIKFSLNAHSMKGVNSNTRIMYRGEKIGSIHDIEQVQGRVKLTAGLLPQYEHILREKSKFWLVTPNLSLSGVTDTDALFGGTYIALSIGEGKLKKEFVVSTTIPAKHISAEGLQLSLASKSGNVVSSGSPVNYRGISVGQVDNVSLDDNGQQVSINLTIDDYYKHLITDFSRFYNASGITVNGGLTNFTVKTDSADSMLQGGISFYNPVDKENDNKSVNEGTRFTLFDDINHAESAGLAVKIFFQNPKGLKENINVEYLSQKIGYVERVEFNNDKLGATAFIMLNDIGSKLAVEGSLFWFSQSTIGLTGNKNISHMLAGGVIQLLPGEGAQKTDFIATNRAPVVKSLPYGLNLKLTADDLGSIQVGAPVLYRKVTVGSVIGVGLDSTSSKVNIFINIDEHYQKLVTTGSHFWNTSGIDIDAGLFSGVKIDSESFETFLSGGIAFATPDDKQLMPAQLYEYSLHNTFEESWKEWKRVIQLD